VHYFCSFYPGRIFQKYKFFDDKIKESPF